MGVTFNEKEQSFVFDFEHDGIEDNVRLTGNGYQIEENASIMAMSLSAM